MGGVAVNDGTGGFLGLVLVHSEAIMQARLMQH